MADKCDHLIKRLGAGLAGWLTYRQVMQATSGMLAERFSYLPIGDMASQRQWVAKNEYALPGPGGQGRHRSFDFLMWDPHAPPSSLIGLEIKFAPAFRENGRVNRISNDIHKLMSMDAIQLNKPLYGPMHRYLMIVSTGTNYVKICKRPREDQHLGVQAESISKDAINAGWRFIGLGTASLTTFEVAVFRERDWWPNVVHVP